MSDFLEWFLGHWHTVVVVVAAVMVGVFLIYRHGSDLLRGKARNPPDGETSAAVIEFLLVAVLILLIGLASRIEQVSARMNHAVAEVKEKQDSADESFNHVSERLDRISSGLPPIHQFEVLEDYDAFVKAIEREVLRTKGRWLITRVQLPQATTKQENIYFKTMTERVRNDDIRDCRRIVRIASEEHLERYTALMKELGKTPYFGMAVWTPKDPPFNFEMLIGDSVVILAYGAADGAGVPTWGIVIPDKSTADHFVTTFNDLWDRANATELIKPLQPLTDEGIQSAIDRMSAMLGPRPAVAEPTPVPEGE